MNNYRLYTFYCQQLYSISVRSKSHLSVDNVDVQAHAPKKTLLIHKINSEHLECNGNVAKQVKMSSEISQTQGTESLKSKLMYREQIRSVTSKILLIALHSQIKTHKNRMSTEKNVQQLITLMLNSQTKFWIERKKLFKAIQHVYMYMKKNEKLDQQMKDATLERYIEHRSEINRIGEKYEETKKVMIASRKEFENNVAGMAPLREKLCDFHNRLELSGVYAHKLKKANLTKKQNLTILLHLKNELQLQKDNLQPYRSAAYDPSNKFPADVLFDDF